MPPERPCSGPAQSLTEPSGARRTIFRRCMLPTKKLSVWGSKAMLSGRRSRSARTNARVLAGARPAPQASAATANEPGSGHGLPYGARAGSDSAAAG
jgi:hypothetical protein